MKYVSTKNLVFLYFIKTLNVYDVMQNSIYIYNTQGRLKENFFFGGEGVKFKKYVILNNSLLNIK